VGRCQPPTQGDNWVAYQVDYGEQNTLYFVSIRGNFAAIDEGQAAFMGALKSSYGAGMEKLLADGDSCLISSRSEDSHASRGPLSQSAG